MQTLKGELHSANKIGDVDAKEKIQGMISDEKVLISK